MKRNLLFVLLISVISLGLFANGDQESTADNGKINLRMVAWDVKQTVYLQPLIDAYTAQHPEVSIELINIPANEYQDKLSIMLSGGDDLDIVTVKDIPGYSGMIKRKLIDPLNTYIDRDNFDLSKYSGLTDDITVDGNLYAIPFRSDFWLMYYNKDIFDKAGVPYPTNDMTWDEYAALAKKVSSGEGADRIYGGHHHTWRSTVQLGTVQDGKHSIISNDYSFMKPMYDMIIDLQNSKAIMDYSSLKVGNLHYSSLFYNDRIAMLPMGSWFISTLIKKHETGEATMDWGLVKFPHQPDAVAGTTAGTITSLAIGSNSKKKEAAWDFIKYYTGTEGAKVLAQTGNLPAIRNESVLSILSSMKGFPEDPASKEALATEKVRLELPIHPKVGAIETILNEEHELILIGENSVDEGLAEMTRRVTEELAQ
ncbi:ABC transporter substrate-binding protein [Spirochaeta cellobiosiphila]|uniref:ABC transporter substrate-binding protein n=1 Tax=Spirochaeta cellobiosiphila TaxID=504483 RepID=UPI00041378A8|nr:sugar ABC transporter substrate-binding protein [Spirochaeta cellobiosiphila]